INSVLFDTARTAASFFANPFGLLPTPPGKELLPRLTDSTGVTVTNPEPREIDITYIARGPDGGLISGAGITNPVTYRFAPGQHFAAFPGEIFREQGDPRALLGAGQVGWLEILSDDAPIVADYLEGDAEGNTLDGNVAAESGGNPIVFPDLRLLPGQGTEI